MIEQSISNEKIIGAIANLPIVGLFFLITEKKNEFIRFYAMQSTLVWVAFFLLTVALNLVPILGVIMTILLFPLIGILFLVALLVPMWKAYSGEKYKLPYFGDLAEKQLKKM
ncbi:hypothetical protein A3I51_02900 [Candidatus Gottesmanbacteria bacterium RIFCSPLOWO2_02_FULL_38_8]|uniref:DUF4870 domain-containing protein n=1 Tax=Candidatus Gottesmanbacteria bacterium RIFCSPLOWO2_02_FULL_38_8 TaxID=1798397 RepID=A0A1F6B5P3_9BACT|nr:MAG: hypothetical protein A3I51_02900 [Candidatus Gottesmanbacteria bacterium RIFCSPLOWO2_02_FULL_38_8]